ncbi:hypothetical protein ABZ924_05485 [Streptomyces sp. NPDC046876]|uniref:hypothetical protein n=1 Tax=Streptomyces sp. NPDC046876 TaxID=3155616 RepID=UPI0033C64E4B
MVGPRPGEAEFAARFAEAAGTTVLYPAVEAPPSAYWAVTPEGLLTRARLELSDDEPPVLTVTAVEAPVPQLPRAEVTWFEEIVREQRPATPVAEGFIGAVGGRADHGLLRSVTGSLVVWERLVRQMESGWAPSGWYPADLYRERLEARDRLEGVGLRLPPDVAPQLEAALGILDGRFEELTEPDPAGGLRRELTGRRPLRAGSVGWWWWFRRPGVVPWEGGRGR